MQAVGHCPNENAAAIRASDPANGTPPLLFHGGSVMDTPSTGPVIVTPVFWSPPGHPMSAFYKLLLTTYLGDVALYLPKHVESCFFAGSTTTAANECTINYQPSAAYCAYHNEATSSAIYANMPYPVYLSKTGFTCGTDINFPGVIESPNHNPDADTEISPSSHEISESITDPDTVTGWYDSSGFENGDECAYIFGQTQGSAGHLYNQNINGLHLLTQEEFSNRGFAITGGGCVQSASAEAP